ncbi:MAG TPA: NAD-dependent epimerase/dehydratase family protein [Solirubrobacteraceae bacterium]
MPRTLVTGATGFIGSHIVRLLVERGDEVLAVVRPGGRLGALEDFDVKPVRADILDRRAIRRAMQGAERVFHVAGTTDLNASRALVFSVNVEGMRIVLEEALRAGVQRAVYTSSVAAIGPARPGKMADERTVWEAGRHAIPYLDAKHEAEMAALRLVARGLPLVIVNPAHVLGGGDAGGSSTTLVRRFMRRQIPAYVDGTLNIVGVQDVARGHLLADERGSIGERYILGNRNFTLDRLFADLGRLSGIEPPALKLPLPVALAIAEAGNRLPGMALPTPVEVRASALRWAFTSRKAKRELGWRPSPHEDCLEETIAWYRARDRGRVAAPGARQPLALRVAGGVLRRIGI